MSRLSNGGRETDGYLVVTQADLLPKRNLSKVPELLPEEGTIVMHEGVRTRLRSRHVMEREKLVLSCEQAIMRVYARAARTIHNQQVSEKALFVNFIL